VNKTFTDIRAKFPDAVIIAMNPIAEDEAFAAGKPDAVRAAVVSVGRTYVDVGHPAMG
jgi:hypothetical protein